MSELTEREVALLKRLCAFISGGADASSDGESGWQQKPATDAQMAERFGDPEVRKDPRRWAGESYVGAKYSQCPSDYLLVMAEFQEFKAGMDAKKPDPAKHSNGTPYYVYNRKDASLARGWARRNEGKALPPPGMSGGSRYGTSGHGANAKHTGTPEPTGASEGEAFDSGDDELPFISSAQRVPGAQRRPKWERF